MAPAGVANAVLIQASGGADGSIFIGAFTADNLINLRGPVDLSGAITATGVIRSDTNFNKVDTIGYLFVPLATPP